MTDTYSTSPLLLGSRYAASHALRRVPVKTHTGPSRSMTSWRKLEDDWEINVHHVGGKLLFQNSEASVRHAGNRLSRVPCLVVRFVSFTLLVPASRNGLM